MQFLNKNNVQKCTFQRKDGKECPGYVVTSPQMTKEISSIKNERLPGVVVIQEWWGVNDQIVGVAEKICNSGFVAVVPDLYRGVSTEEAREAGHHMGDLGSFLSDELFFLACHSDWKDAAVDVEAAATYMKEVLGCPKVGVVGFCVGGALTIIVASHNVPAISTAVCYYGYIPDDTLGDPSKIRIPIQCHFAMKDHCIGFADPKTADILESKMKKGGVNYQFLRYDTGHSFMNENYVLRRSAQYPETYVEKIAEDSLNKTTAFLREHLRTNPQEIQK